jgi:hypothetical protein
MEENRAHGSAEGQSVLLRGERVLRVLKWDAMADREIAEGLDRLVVEGMDRTVAEAMDRRVVEAMDAVVIDAAAMDAEVMDAEVMDTEVMDTVVMDTEAMDTVDRGVDKGKDERHTVCTSCIQEERDPYN